MPSRPRVSTVPQDPRGDDRLSDSHGSADCQECAERLVECVAPPDVLQALGLWLACRLHHPEFSWTRSRKSLRRRADGRTETIVLKGSRWNRRDSSITVDVVSLDVDDDVLRDWRVAHPDLTADRSGLPLAIACWTSYYDRSKNARSHLTRPSRRVAAAELLLADVERVAIPWFESTRDPENLASAVPDSLLRPTAFAQDLVELLVSRGLTEQATALVERFASLSPAHEDALRQGREMAKAGERPRWHSAPALG